MAFNLGSFAVKEIIYGVAQDFDDNLLYTLDQLTSAQIEVSADPTEVTDKNGNIIRSIYNSKTATFTSTSALLSPAILNAGSGSDMEVASSSAAIEMPFITVIAPGVELDISGAVADSIHVMGLFNNGANGKVLTASTSASYEAGTYAYDSVDKTITAPAAATGAADKYLVKYQRSVTSGLKLTNKADAFPDTIQLTLYAAVMDPCDDQYKAAYIYIPSFQPDPSMTISLDAENQEVDYNGNINVDYCSSDGKTLYLLYFPDENAVTSVVTA